jgi:hypothetical protein
MSNSAITIDGTGSSSSAALFAGQPQDTARTVSIHRSWSSLETVSKQWNDWQQNPNADPEFVKFILGIRPECEHPYAIAIQKGRQLEALMVGRVEHPRVSIKVGYLQVARPKLRIISFLYGGLLGALDEQSADELVKAVVDSISARDADAAFFSNVRQDSPLTRSLGRIPGFFRRDVAVKVQPHHSMKIPQNSDAFYARLSPKVRKNQKWQAKKLLESFAQRVEVRSYTHTQDLRTLFEDVDQVARSTYQRGLGVGFVDTPETRGRMELAARKGWLQAFVLYLADKPGAFWIGTRYRNRFFSDFMGYEATHAKYSPGMYLVLKGIEQFCGESGSDRISEIDFGLGDAQYKQVLATDSWIEQSSYIYSTSARGLALNLSRAITGLVDRSARRILRKLNLEDTIKSGWRKRLARQ